MTCTAHASLTLEDKIRAAYHDLLRAGDHLPDSNDLDHAAHLLGDALGDDLASPYCREDGCGEPRLPSFPWCAAHTEPRP